MNLTARPRLVQMTIVLGQFVFSLLANTLQPMLPAVQEALGLTLLEASFLPTIMTVTLTVTNLAVGIFIGKAGIKTIMIASGVLGIAASLFVAAGESLAGLIAAYIVFGMTMGSAFTSLTTMYTHLPERYRDFGLYHAFYGLGGIVAPVILGLVLGSGRSYRVLFWVYIVLLAVFAVFLFFTKVISNQRYPGVAFAEIGAAFRSPVILLGIAVLGCYAASEIGVTTYAGNMHINAFGLDAANASFLLSLFWILFTASRAVTDPAVRRFGIRTMGWIAGVGAFVSLAVWMTGLTIAAFPLIGLFMGPIFPIYQKYVNDHLAPGMRGIFNGALYASVGAFTTLALPVMGAAGGIRAEFAFLAPAVLTIAMIMLIPILLAKASRKSPGPDARAVPGEVPARREE